MNWSWLFNLLFWRPFKTVAVRITLEDGFHKKRKVVYFRLEKHKHRKI